MFSRMPDAYRWIFNIIAHLLENSDVNVLSPFHMLTQSQISSVTAVNPQSWKGSSFKDDPIHPSRSK